MSVRLFYGNILIRIGQQHLGHTRLEVLLIRLIHVLEDVGGAVVSATVAAAGGVMG